jgi:hypothetical protein
MELGEFCLVSIIQNFRHRWGFYQTVYGEKGVVSNKGMEPVKHNPGKRIMD